jgi:hypothetical protein
MRNTVLLFMAKAKLTIEDFENQAKVLRVETAVIRAVAEVESKRAGFDSQDRVTILFERHKFYKYTRYRKDFFRQYPDICNPNPGGYGKTSDQYPKFSRAFDLDQEPAMMACSWGAFQEMGFNYDDLGFSSVGEMVDKMKESEAAQLEIFVRSVRAKGLVDELRRKDWKSFAFGYNGPAYRKNRYDEKMAAAYQRLKAYAPTRRRDDAEKPDAETRERENAEIEFEEQPTKGEVSEIHENSTSPDLPERIEETLPTLQVAETVEINAPPPTGFLGKIKQSLAGLGLSGAGILGLKEYLNISISAETLSLLKILIPCVLILGAIALIIWYLSEKVVGWKRLKLEAEINSNPKTSNIEIIKQ